MDEYAPLNRTWTSEKKDSTITIKNNIVDKIITELGSDIPNDHYNVDEHHYVTIAMKSLHMAPSEVAKQYFSVTNIKRIQKGIKREIYNRSYKKFKLTEDQSVLDLLTVMISVFIYDSKSLPFGVVRQTKVLNERTIQYVAPGIMDNLIQYYMYLDDIKNPVNPLPQPININNAGRKQLKSVAQLYGL